MASIFQSAEWKSAREYASDFAEQLKKDLPPQSDAVVWDSSYTSDHLPVTAMLPNESIALLSWNLCNSVWMKYQEAREDSGQRLYDHPAFAKENRESRLLAQKDYIEKQIVQHQNNGLIIFLQEVSPLMSLILEKCFDRTHHVLRFVTNAKETNFNVTMLPRHNVTYNYVYGYGFSDKFKEFSKQKTAAIYVIKLNANNENIVIVNAHLDFGTNKQFAEALLAESDLRNIRIFVAGDFNASLRTPVAGECDNVTAIYSDYTRFNFFSRDPTYNHLNLFRNTVDKSVPGLEDGAVSRMYDRFDHFMVARPPH